MMHRPEAQPGQNDAIGFGVPRPPSPVSSMQAPILAKMRHIGGASMSAPSALRDMSFVKSVDMRFVKSGPIERSSGVLTAHATDP